MSLVRFSKISSRVSPAPSVLTNDDDDDDEPRFDYVLVIQKDVKKSKNFKYLERFIRIVQERGIYAELDHGKIGTNVYIKLGISNEAISRLAKFYQVDLENTGHKHFSVSQINLKILDTDLIQNNVFRKKGQATTMERIFILHSLLEDVRYSIDKDYNFGISRLIKLGVVKAAYPLHDGDCNYEDSNDFLNDRQLLLKYWANLSVWYKTQPLNLIEKYYGTEVAFYFAFLGLYNVMLIPAAVIGIICFLISLAQDQDERVQEVCDSKLLTCPPCAMGSICYFNELKIDCSYAQIATLFDNYSTFFFAIFMAVWASAFMNFWKREESILKMRWNVDRVTPRIRTRAMYQEKTTYRKKSPISGRLSAYTPLKIKMCRYFLSYLLCLLLIGIVVLCALGIIMHRIIIMATIRRMGVKILIINGALIESTTTAIIQVIFIKLYEKIYGPASEYLTNLENPEKQTEYEDAVIYKRYVLAFSNNYLGLFYIAFLKGQFFNPAHTKVPSFSADMCHTFGCLMALCVQLLVILLFKRLVGYIFAMINRWRKARKKKKIENTESVPQWEKDFLLKPHGNRLLTKECMDTIIQYGFVTFFVAAFPLTPAFALIINCLQLRMNAYQLVTKYRRPIPKLNPGMGIWNAILKNLTFLSKITNAFIIAFTCDFVAREIYRYNFKTLRGYVKSTLSRYDMAETEKFKNTKMVFLQPNTTICYYRGHRYPPEHPDRYQLTPYFWYEFGMKLFCVIIFEHLFFLMDLIFSRVLSDASKKMRNSLFREKNRKANAKLDEMHEKAKKLSNFREKLKVVLPRKNTQDSN